MHASAQRLPSRARWGRGRGLLSRGNTKDAGPPGCLGVRVIRTPSDL